MAELRDYQIQMHDDINKAWASGHMNVLAVLPTGAGKTVTFAKIVKEHVGCAIVMAHRAELIAQMSLALAREGVYHRIIGPATLVRLCVTQHKWELANTFYDPSAPVGVGSVQSIVAYTDIQNWFSRVTLWVGDEFHHYIRDNQFGKALARFPRARGLGVTATPGRLDGKGLGRHADGVIDKLIIGPTPRELIERGFLSKYRIFAPQSDLHVDQLKISAGGDYSPVDLQAETRRSTVLGDIVEHYVKHALGKSGLTFADSIANGEIIRDNFRVAGVSAELLTGKTPDALRAATLRRYKNREIYQIISVALIDEGFDCPGVEVISDGAATKSFNRFCQRFGRGMRIMEGKTHMIYFDHVGNTLRLGLPDATRIWSLNRRDKNDKSESVDFIPIRICVNPECVQPYLRTQRVCPYCGNYPIPAQRKGPDFVDGDLTELDAATIGALLGEVARIDAAPVIPYGAKPEVVGAVKKRHYERQLAQSTLRESIALWSGSNGHMSLSEQYRLFYFKFGIDVLSAMALGARAAVELNERIKK